MKISGKKREKISEQILSVLFENSPKSMFTSHIAMEIARDEEFVKDLLNELSNKKLVVPIKKNPEGIVYSRRIRWRLSNQAYDLYSKLSEDKNNIY